MKTPQQWIDSWPPSDLFHFNHEKEQQKTLEFISSIQKEAFEEGRLSMVQFIAKELDGLINIPTNTS